jgi:hypothetical protein
VPAKGSASNLGSFGVVLPFDPDYSHAAATLRGAAYGLGGHRVPPFMLVTLPVVESHLSDLRTIPVG